MPKQIRQYLYFVLFLFLLLSCKKDKFYQKIEGEWQLNSAEIAQENTRNYIRTYNGNSYSVSMPYSYNVTFDGSTLTGHLEEDYYYTENIFNVEADYAAYEDIEREMNETWTFSEDGTLLSVENQQIKRNEYSATSNLFYRKKEDGSYFSLPTSYFRLTTFNYSFQYAIVFTSAKDAQTEKAMLTLSPISAALATNTEYYILNPDGTGFTGDYYIKTSFNSYELLATYNTENKTTKTIAPDSRTWTIETLNASTFSISAADSSIISTEGDQRKLKFSATLNFSKK